MSGRQWTRMEDVDLVHELETSINVRAAGLRHA